MGLLAMAFPKDGNTLIIDGGDTIQGSPLTYYFKQKGLLPPVAPVLNALGYDYVTLGNHDFNNGRAYLGQYLTELNARCLCANVRDTRGDLPIFPAAVHTLENGLRVGLVGIVTDWVNRWEKQENLAGIVISDPLAAAREAISGLQADILIGIYHGGIERDLTDGRLLSQTDENIACRLCEELPFDLLLTGHQHISLTEGHWHGAHIVQTPCNAAAYIRVTLDDDGVFRSALCPVPDHAALTQEQAQLWEELNAWLDTPIGHLSRPIWPGEKLDIALHGSAIADFFNTVQLWASGADLSCAALANELRGFDSDVTVRDVVASYVYANTLVVLQVTGQTLREALEQCARYFSVDGAGRVSVSDSFLRPKEAHYNYDYFSGIEYTFDLAMPEGSRVVSLTRRGVPVDPNDTFSLVMCDYRAAGSGNFDCYRACPRLREIQTEVSELILNYLAAHDRIPIPEEHPLRVVYNGKPL